MENGLNVCLVNDSFPPSIDGVANTVFNYASIIEKKYGHAIVSTPYYPDIKDNYDFEVLRYASVDTTSLVGYRAGMPLDLKYLQQFAGRNVDIIHSHCPIASNYMARIMRDTIKKPLVFTYHTKFDIDIRNAITGKLIQEAAIKALVSNIEPCDDVWVVSRGAGENLKSLGYSGDYVVMPNGVDFPKGQVSRKKQDQVMQEYHLTHDRPIYLFVGRMMWYKGLKIILDALRELKNHEQPFTMLFIGDSLELDDIRKYSNDIGLGDSVIFTGAIRDREKLRAFFSLADLFLFPSTFDTAGIVVREAAACRLGSVLIKGSCSAEDVTDGRNAILIEENSESMARFLLENGSNLDYLHRIGKNAQHDLYMSWEESVDRAIERYHYVIDTYQYKKPFLLDSTSTLGDNFLAFTADIANALDKAAKLNQEVNNRFNDLLDRWL